MSDKIISMASKTGDAYMQSPEQALQDAIKDIGVNGAFEKGKKLIILALDDTEGEYKVNFIQAGMKMSECVTLCEVGKIQFLTEMNHIHSHEGE